MENHLAINVHFRVHASDCLRATEATAHQVSSAHFSAKTWQLFTYHLHTAQTDSFMNGKDYF